MSIEGKIDTNTNQCNRYFTKYILERVYDKVIEWVMFNNISNSPMYVQDKQETICNLIYTFPIGEAFKTPELKNEIERSIEQIRELERSITDGTGDIEEFKAILRIIRKRSNYKTAICLKLLKTKQQQNKQSLK